MPLKLVYGRKKTKAGNIYIRGSYLGIRVDKSSGTNRGRVAGAKLKALERAIELGEYPAREAPARSSQPTFLSAANAYMEAGRRRRYVAMLIKYFGETPLDEIDQAAIDRAAMALHPHVTAATRNSYVYTPVSAILHHAKVAITVTRPPGAKGRVIKDWLPPVDAFGIIAGADTFDFEIGTLLAFLLYTGPRIGGALNLDRDDVLLDEGTAWARPQKGQSPMDAKLREDLRLRLAALLASHERQRVFRFHQGGHLKHQLTRAKLSYLGLPCPVRPEIGWRQPPNRLQWVTFHIWRHTWATWMRRYGGATIDDLVDSGNWKTRRSAARYVHAAAEGVWDRTALLPSMGKTRESGAG